MKDCGVRVAVAAAECGVEAARVARRAGGSAALLEASPRALARLGAPAELIAAVAGARRLDVPAYRARLAERGIEVAGVDDDGGYPVELATLHDPPPAVFIRGRRELLQAPAGRVAIVGARRAADTGLRLARELARFCAARERTVVSGLALGIDAAAHAGSLDGGGATIAVLGCGVDVTYPRTNAGLFDRVAGHGLLLSEYPPGTPPAPWRFPARNRLIAALAATVLVVEARARSGALITADMALDLGRDVLAVPGSPAFAGAAGTNGLLKAGAGLIEDAADLAGWLGVEPPEAADPNLDSRSAAFMDALAVGPATADDLCQRLGWPPADVAATTIRLELAGLLARERGGRLAVARRL
jgi:DNA processing protein